MANNDTQLPSRKWRLVLFIVLLASVACFLPPIISVWFLKQPALILLTGAEYCSLITLVVSAYFGVNVWQKHVERGYINYDNENVNEEEIEDEEENNCNEEEENKG